MTKLMSEKSAERPIRWRGPRFLRRDLEGNGFPAESRFIDDVWRGEIVGHEMVHLVLMNLARQKQMGTLLHEALADYFQSSASDVSSPVTGEGMISGINIREGTRRESYKPEEDRLNYNSTAQFKGEAHEDSQVLYRLLWELRSRLGRHILDPKIIESLNHLDYFWSLNDLDGSPVVHGQKGQVRDAFGHLMESYAFLGSLVLATVGSLLHQEVLEVASSFGFSAEAIEYLVNKVDPTAISKLSE